jgi:hypothetical protein
MLTLEGIGVCASSQPVTSRDSPAAGTTTMPVLAPHEEHRRSTDWFSSGADSRIVTGNGGLQRGRVSTNLAYAAKFFLTALVIVESWTMGSPFQVPRSGVIHACTAI